MKRGSTYLGSTPKRALSRPRRFGSLAAIFLVFAVMLGTFASIPLLDSIFSKPTAGSSKSAGPVVNDASALWCSDPKEGNLGLGMDNRSDWRSGAAWYPHADTSGRVLTSQEAFGNGISFKNFNGVGESPGLPWFWISPPVGLGESGDDPETGGAGVVDRTGNTPEGAGTENWFKNMNSSRTPTKCVMGAIGTSVANGILGITGGVTNLMGGISTFAFDPNFICEPNSGATNCIDLVGIIGGSGNSNSGDGIIGKLTTSVYFPLLTLAALLVGVWIVWNGIAKRQFRETFLGVLWSVVVTILGIAMLLNPLMLAKAPMVVGNALTSCIIGAFTGSGGCAGGTSTTPPTGAAAFCAASSSKNNFMDQAAITMTSMSCELWKAFVLQPYAQGSFGASLDQLDTSNSNTIAGKLLAKNPGFDSKTFCVGTKVNGKLEDSFGKTLPLSGNTICNLAVYQAYLSVDAKMDTAPALSAPGSIDDRWLKVAQFAATDEGMYRAWAPSDMHFAQIGMAILGLISAILAAIVIFVVAAFALAFYITSILMIAFAPFFLLAGVHPGKGRKMMIGWIGQVLSNVMKYAASAIFLVITVSLYGAVLSNVSNPGAILIFMIILTVALLMYRREIVDMIGVIDLGGEKLSNKFAERTMDRVRNTGKTAMAVSGGAVAGVLANGVRNPFSAEMRGEGNLLEQMGNMAKNNIRHDLQNVGNVGRAASDAGRRSLKSRPGMIGEVMKASDRISADNRKDMTDQARGATIDAQKASQDRSEKQGRFEGLNSELESSRTATEAKIEDLKDRSAAETSRQFDTQSQLDKLSGAQGAALGAISNTSFREYQDLLNQMKNLDMKATISEESGLTGEAQNYRNGADSIRAELDTVQSKLSDEDFESGQRQYSTALANNLGDDRVTPDNAAGYEDHVRGEYQKVMATIGGAAAKNEELKAKQAATEAQLKSAIAGAAVELEDAKYAEKNTETAAERARNKVTDLKPGQVVKNSAVRKNAAEIAAQQNDRSRELHDLSSSVAEQMLDSAETHVDAVGTREAWKETVAAEQRRVAESQAAARRVNDVRRDVQQSKQDAVRSWKDTDPQNSDDRARKAYIAHLDAEAAAAQAAAKTEALSTREANDGGLSEVEKSDLFIAKREELAAKARMEASEKTIRGAGSDLRSMRSELKKAVEAEYAKKSSSSNMKMDEGLDSFERNLNDAAAEIKGEMESRRAELQRAQENAAAAAKAAELANRDAQKLSEAAKALSDKASNDKPVSDRGVARAASRASKVTGRAADRARGLPRLDGNAPVDQGPEGVQPRPTDNTPGSDDGNPFRGGNPFKNQR